MSLKNIACSADLLPYDCLFLIFKHLSFIERIRCERVSKKWRTILTDVNSSIMGLCIIGEDEGLGTHFCSEANHEIDELNHVLDGQDLYIQPIITRCPNLKSLHLRCGQELVEECSKGEFIARSCPDLEHLSFIDNCYGVGILREVIPILSYCKSIRHLQLNFTLDGSDGVLQENHVIMEAVSLLPDLKVLSVNVPLTVDSSELLASWNLEELEMRSTRMTPAGLQIFICGNGRKLKKLTLLVEDDEYLELICENMQSLVSFHCVIGQYVENIGIISKLSLLRDLFLSSWSSSPLESSLNQIINSCNKLTSLTISANISDVSLINIHKGCPLLQRLEIALNPVESLTDETALNISKVNNLRYLSIQTCKFTDDGYKVILLNCEQLTFYQIGYSDNLTVNLITFLIDFQSKRIVHNLEVILPELFESELKLIREIPRNLAMSSYRSDYATY